MQMLGLFKDVTAITHFILNIQLNQCFILTESHSINVTILCYNSHIYE